MRKTIILTVCLMGVVLTACAPQASAVPTALPAPKPTAIVVPPTAAAPTVNTYQNAAFGLSFQYPIGWFGPEEYVVDQTLRVEVGSDKVYPYGTDRMEQIYTLKNSYAVLIQYTQNNQNDYWQETYQVLLKLKDGESFADARSKIIRVRQIDLGKFKGIEYISTLSDTAQTEPVYGRQIILVDDRSNLLSIMGSPNNVEAGADWRAAYQAIDQANEVLFHQIVDSITIK